MIRWFKRWGWVLVLAVGAVALLILTGGKVRLPVKREVAAAKAEARALKRAADVGYDQAIHEVEQEYTETVSRLDAEKAAQAAELRADPGKLAAFLVRVGDQA